MNLTPTPIDVMRSKVNCEAKVLGYKYRVRDINYMVQLSNKSETLPK